MNMMDDEDILADKFYNLFMENQSVVGFDGLMKKYKIGSKRRTKIRNIIYQKYGKDDLIKIYRSRLSKLRQKRRRNFVVSDDTKSKISTSNKLYWEKNKERKKISRNLMIRYCHPKSWTKETNDKRVQSRIKSGYKHSTETKQKISNSNKGRSLSDLHKQKLRKTRIRRGVPHNNYTKKILSEKCKLQWACGIHKPIYKSKGHVEIMNILKELGYSIKDEYIVFGKPYDVFIPSKNILIEYNGTYWHRDTRFYDNTSDSRKIWARDAEKIDKAVSSGYVVKTIWQYDWEKCKNKVDFLRRIINE